MNLKFISLVFLPLAFIACAHNSSTSTNGRNPSATGDVGSVDNKKTFAQYVMDHALMSCSDYTADLYNSDGLQFGQGGAGGLFRDTILAKHMQVAPERSDSGFKRMAYSYVLDDGKENARENRSYRKMNFRVVDAIRVGGETAVDLILDLSVKVRATGEFHAARATTTITKEAFEAALAELNKGKFPRFTVRTAILGRLPQKMTEASEAENRAIVASGKFKEGDFAIIEQHCDLEPRHDVSGYK